MTRLAVVGGGIAGLAAARFARDAGVDEVVVLEGSPRVGGKLLVREVGDVAVDVGAEAMLAARPEGRELLAACGLAGDRISPLTTSARIRADGRSHPLPARTMLGIPGDVEALRASGALSPAGLDAVAEEPSMPPLPPLTRDVPVGMLVRYRLGDEVADRLVEPLLGGVYAGSADLLSLRAAIPKLAALLEHGGSLLELTRSITGVGTRPAGGPPVFASLRGGLARLPTVIAGSLDIDVRTGVTVRDIERTSTGFVLGCSAAGQPERLTADAVVVATPAGKSARLLGALAPGAATELAAIQYANIAIVSLAFDDVHDALAEHGSGLLVGARERLATKAVTLTSNKWAVGSGGRFVLRASVGRHGEAQALQLDDADLTEVVRGDLRVLFGLTAHPVDSLVTRWGGGLPQYAVGHVERIGRVRAALAEVPGLAACGAAFDGVGVPACVASARAAVDRVLGDLGATSTLNT